MVLRTLPQLPQFCESLLVLTHAPLQHERGAAHGGLQAAHWPAIAIRAVPTIQLHVDYRSGYDTATIQWAWVREREEVTHMDHVGHLQVEEIEPLRVWLYVVMPVGVCTVAIGAHIPKPTPHFDEIDLQSIHGFRLDSRNIEREPPIRLRREYG